MNLRSLKKLVGQTRFSCVSSGLIVLLIIWFTCPSATFAGKDTGSESGKPADAMDAQLDFLETELGGKQITVYDPLAPFNRVMFQVNDKLYFWVLKPVAQGYKLVMPQEIRFGLKNFFSNLAMPVRFVNCVFQGKFKSAGNEFARFFINTTVGVLGFGNPADVHDRLKINDEDMGQTFAVYGIGEGIYLVWPILGPSTLRDTVGDIGDRFLSPITYVQPSEASTGISAGKVINATSFRIGDYETLKETALDPYEALKSIYIQNRNKKIKE